MTSRKVFDVCVVMGKLNAIAGQEGSWTMAQIKAFSRGSRSTVDRQLRQAAAWGWVNIEWVAYRGAERRMFSLTETGKSFDDIPF
jgi:hypothetical protein